MEAGRQSSKLGIGNWMPFQLNTDLETMLLLLSRLLLMIFSPRMNGNVTLMKKIVHLFIFSNCLFTTVHIIMDDKAMPFLFLCGRLHLPNWCYFGDVFNGRILRPLPPTSESVLIPWPIPRSSSLFFPSPSSVLPWNKEECRTKSLQAALKGMPLFLLHFCYYSLLSRSLHVTHACFCMRMLAQAR